MKYRCAYKGSNLTSLEVLSSLFSLNYKLICILYRYIAWQLLKTKIVVMPVYLEILFQVGVPSLALVKVMWFEDLTHIPLLYIQKQNSKMEKENFFIIKWCREPGGVTRISLQAHPQEKCILD